MSLVKRLQERLGGFQAVSAVKQTAMATGNAVRQGGESLLIGGALGFLHVEKGLDIKKVPVDAAIGAMGLVAGIGLAHEEYARDLQNAGSAALSIFAFRKSAEFAAKKRAERGAGAPVGRMAGEADWGAEEYENDAILEAARQMAG